MNKRSFPIILGISLLAGIVTLVVFQETRYFETGAEPFEITYEKYHDMKTRFCDGCAEAVTKKKVYNYELGGLVFISTFATLLIVSNLKRK